MTRRLFATVSALLSTACGEEKVAEVPPPARLDRKATADFTGMITSDHDGPKGQIGLGGQDTPLWFSNVRDSVAFTMLAEEPDGIATYIHDIAGAEPWAHPGPDAWMPARDSVCVIGSRRRGGIGAPAPVPFSSHKAAQAFADSEGGRVVTFDEIPRDFIFGRPHAPPIAESSSARDTSHARAETGDGQ